MIADYMKNLFGDMMNTKWLRSRRFEQNLQSVSAIPSGRELLYAWKLCLACVVAVPISFPIIDLAAWLIESTTRDDSPIRSWFESGSGIPIVLYGLSILIILLSLPLTYVVRSGSEEIGRLVWVIAVGSCLVLRYIYFHRHLIGVLPPLEEEALVYGLLIALLSFPSSLLVWLSSDWPPHWDWLVAILGYLQWIIIIPAMVLRFRSRAEVQGQSDDGDLGAFHRSEMYHTGIHMVVPVILFVFMVLYLLSRLAVVTFR